MPPRESTTILLVAHGSTVPAANESIQTLAKEIGRRADIPALGAFLDVAQPDIAAAVEQAVGGGSKRVIIIPYFLMMGVHVREDLPRLVKEQQVRFPGVEIVLGESLEGHPDLVRIILDRVSRAMGVRS